MPTVIGRRKSVWSRRSTASASSVGSTSGKLAAAFRSFGHLSLGCAIGCVFARLFLVFVLLVTPPHITNSGGDKSMSLIAHRGERRRAEGSIPVVEKDGDNEEQNNHIADGQPLQVHAPPPPTAIADGEEEVVCTTRFIRYIPSPFEASWAAAATDAVVQSDGLCVLLHSGNFSQWATTYGADCARGALITDAVPVGEATASRRPDLKSLDPNVYSAFEYERVCRGDGMESLAPVNSPLIVSDVTTEEEEEEVNDDHTGRKETGAMGRGKEKERVRRQCSLGGDNGCAASCGVICSGQSSGAAFDKDSSASAKTATTTTIRCGSKTSSSRVVRRTIFRTLIEPLVGHLRDPRFCEHFRFKDPTARTNHLRAYVFSKSWMLLDPLGTYTNASLPHRRFLFDMGASTWGTGLGGASQSWFYHTYRAYGADFSEIYAWELTQVNATTFFSDIPDHLKPSYHYFNEGMSPAWGSWDNPLRHVLQRTSPDDFVVVKLDIDSGQIEAGIIDAIAGAKQTVAPLIDELFFEHHVSMEMLRDPWGNTIDRHRTYGDSLRLFSNLRRAGIRAHSWV